MRLMTKFLHWTLTVALLFGLTGVIQTSKAEDLPEGHLTLERAVEIALLANPMVRASLAGLEVASAQLDEAKSGRLPYLEFNQKYINSNNPVFVFGSRLEQAKFGMENFSLDYLNNPGSYNNFRSSLNLKIPVFNRFKVSSGIDQAEISREQAESDAAWVEQQIRLEVVKAYFGLIVSRAREEVALEAVTTAESDLSNIQGMYEQGMVVASDVLSMEVQLADFRQQLAEAQSDARTALAALNTVLSLPVETPHRVPTTLEERAFALESQQELLAQALQSRPDYLRSEKDVELTQQAIRVSKGSYWPDLNLFAEYGLSSRDLASGSADFAVGAALNFPILDFGRSARVSKAVANSNGARAQQDQKANEVKFEVVSAYQGFLSSQERLKVAQAAVDSAAETLRIVRDRHGVGLETVTEVLRAQTALLRAQMMLLAARYGLYVGYATTKLVSGSLVGVAEFTG